VSTAQSVLRKVLGFSPIYLCALAQSNSTYITREQVRKLRLKITSLFLCLLVIAIGSIIVLDDTLIKIAYAQTTGLVAAYPFNEGTGTVAGDISGVGPAGTLTNGTAWTSQGKYGSALAFDGVNDYVELATTTPYAITTQPFTVSAWVYLNSFATSNYPHVITLRTNTSSAYQIFLSNQSSYLGIAIGSASSWARLKTNTSAASLTGGWHHVAVTYTGTGASTANKFKIYLDGVSKTLSNAGTFTPLSQGNYIGWSGAPGEYWNGRIDEVRMYNRVLTQTEIQNDMNTPLASDTVPPTVSLTSPLQGTTVSGTVTVSANASDNAGVAGVQFKLDGANLGIEDTVSPYSISWNTTTALNGSSTLTAVARDGAGNVITSAAVSVTVSNLDPTPPSMPTGLSANAVSSSQINLSWTASTDNVGVAGYKIFRCQGAGCTPTVQIATSTVASYSNTGLPPSTTYVYTVLAFDAAGNMSVQSAAASATTPAGDTTPPAVSITSPLSGATVSGTIPVSANASDNVGVAGVQFKLDGANLGAEDTVSPYSTSWNTTTALNGSSTLTAVARDGAGNASTSVAVSVTVSNANPNDPSVIGQWAGPYTWPIVAVHMSLLPNGKVLAWDDHTSNDGATVWEPATNTFTPVPNNSDNLFCSGHTETADGKVMVVGGHIDWDVGTHDINVFDPTTQTWSLAAPMSIGRWYPTGTTLNDGRVLATLGTINCRTCIAGTPEVYSPVTNSWTSLTGANLPFTPYFPHMFVLPNGKVFAAASSENNIVSRILDVAAQTWTNVGSDAIDGGASVMYQPGKVMKSGGAWDDGTGTPSPTAYVIDMTHPSPAWRQVGSMTLSRVTHNQTPLPDGNVLVTGGSTNANVSIVSAAVYEAEMWSPTTETWKTMARMQVQRVYHSTALLMPDGRVLVGGGGRFDSGINQFSVEIYSPPYLFQGVRPAIASAPGTLQYASSFFVGTPDASRIASVSLIRLGSVTHAFNQNQRFMNLTFQPAAGGITIQAPQDGNYAPPGYYMLFLVDANGVPSIASFVRLPAPYEDTQPPTALTNLTASGSIGSASLSWTAATDNFGVTGYHIHRSPTSGFTPSAANEEGETTETTFTDSGIAGTYYYVVIAHDAAGNTSLPSNEAIATASPDTIPPSTPTGLIAIAVSSAQIDLSWTTSTDNVGVEGYQVFRNGSQVATTTASTYSNIGLTASTTYTYTVTAFDASANIAPPSQAVSVTTLPGSSLPPGLVATYSFSEGTGLTTTDDSGNGNTGTLTNGPTWTLGKYGNALSYNGIDTYVSVRNTFDIAALPFTIAAWVNPINYNDYRKIFSKRTSWAANNMRVDLTLYSGNGHVVLEQPNAILDFSYSPPLNTWTHLAVVARPTGTDLYVNGNLMQTLGAFTLGSNAAAPVRLGRAGDDQDPFLGRIDNLRIYNRALNQSEIQSDMVSIQ
jgi:chitodextrinase